MTSTVHTQYLQLAYQLSDRQSEPSRSLDKCYPVNGSIPIPVLPRRSEAPASARWKAVDTIETKGGVYEVAIRRVR